MKTILRLIGGMLVGACIGMIVVIPIIAIIDGESLTTVARGIISKFSLQDVVDFVWLLTAVLISYVLNIAIHEAGHLVAGLLTGYRFVSYRFLNLTLIRKEGRLQWRNFEMAGTGGQCLMAPPDKPLEQIDTRWYNAGGMLANLLLAGIAAVALWAFDLPFGISTLMWMIIVLGLFIGLANGIPMKMGGVANDGLNLLQLEKDNTGKQCFCNILEMNARNQEGEAYNDMPEHLFALPQPIDWKNSMHVGATLAAETRMLARHEWDDAYRLIAEALSHKESYMELYQLELENMMTFTCIAMGRDDEARQHYSDKLAKYVTRHASTQSDKQLTTMATALALEGDRPRAEKILHQLEADRDKYVHQSDVALSLDLMRWLLNNRQA